MSSALGYNHLSATRTQPNANTTGIPAQFGIQGVPQGNSNGGLGTIFLTGLNQLGSNDYLPSIELSTTSQITDNLTKTVGRHTLKAGFQWQRLGFAILQPIAGEANGRSAVITQRCDHNRGNTGLAQMPFDAIPRNGAGRRRLCGRIRQRRCLQYRQTVDEAQPTMPATSRTTSR